VGRRHGCRHPAGSEIFRVHVSTVVDEHVEPPAPVTLVTSMRLLIRQHLAHTFERIAQARRKYPERPARWAIHGASSFRGAPSG
jgi:hypothetical protein